MKVRERMENSLWAGYSMEPDDVYQAMQVTIRQINAESHYYIGLTHKDNPELKTPFKDCWETDEDLYTEESVENLFFYTVRNHVFRWCIAKINGLK